MRITEDMVEAMGGKSSSHLFLLSKGLRKDTRKCAYILPSGIIYYLQVFYF